MKTWIWFGVASLLYATAVFAVETSAAAPPAYYAENEELKAYIAEALDKNPGLRAMFEEYRAAMERITMAGALDDPKFSYTYYAQSQDRRYRVGVMQDFPWFGTLKLREAASTAEAEGALQRFYAQRNQVVADVKRAYHEYAYLGENIRITQAQGEILKYMEDVIRSRYSLGISNEDELLRVQIEQSKLQDQYAALEQFRPALAAQLTAALGREAAAPPEWPQPMGMPPAPPPAPVILAQVRVANPELLSMEKVVEGRKTGIHLARKMGYPMVGFSLEFEKMKGMGGMPKSTALLEAADAGKRLATFGEMDWIGTAMDIDMLARTPKNLRTLDTKDDVMIGVTVSLPIWRQKIRAGVAEAEKMASSAAYAKQKAALSMESDARMAIYNYEDAQRRVTLYETNLLPAATQTYESLQARYSTGAGASFLDLLDSVRNLLDFSLEKSRATHDVHLAAAEIERLLGGPWASDGTAPSGPVPASPNTAQ